MSNDFSFHWPLGVWSPMLFSGFYKGFLFLFIMLSEMQGFVLLSPFPSFLTEPYGGTVLISLVIKSVPSFYALWSNVASYVGQLIARIFFTESMSASMICPAASCSGEGV